MTDLTNATGNGTTEFVIPPGVYRLADEALVISATINFVLTAAGVELICEVDGSHFRLLNKKNLTIKGAGCNAWHHAIDFTRILGRLLQCKVAILIMHGGAFTGQVSSIAACSVSWQ